MNSNNITIWNKTNNNGENKLQLIYPKIIINTKIPMYIHIHIQL